MKIIGTARPRMGDRRTETGGRSWTSMRMRRQGLHFFYSKNINEEAGSPFFVFKKY